MYTVTVKSVSGRKTPSTPTAPPAGLREYTPAERDAFAWARANQGFAGTFEEWMSLGDYERGDYERGAAGIPTA
jgi:hypothetical protein